MCTAVAPAAADAVGVAGPVAATTAPVVESSSGESSSGGVLCSSADAARSRILALGFCVFLGCYF